MTLRLAGEHYEGYARILVLEGGGVKLYIIDHYELLEKEPSCDKAIELEGARLCYIELGEGCEAVVLITGGRREIISLRLYTAIDRDPAQGDPGRAREHCLRTLSNLYKQ